MNRIPYILTVCAFVLSTPGVRAQELARTLDETISAFHAAQAFNGAVLVAKGDDVLLSKGYGTAVMEWDIAVTPDTRFRIGSVTKQFTAAIILKLEEAGRIDLQAKLRTYIPDYPSSQADRITIHQLLTHTSGLPSYTELPRFMEERTRRAFAPDSMFAEFAHLPLEFEPGSAWNYSNSGYFVLGAVIERVTGKPYDRVLREMLLDPLGLRASGYEHNEDVIEHMAGGYVRMPGGMRRAAWLDASVPYAAGMMYATVGDLYRWTRALHAGQVFSKSETLEQMTTPVMENYGYGLAMHTVKAGEREWRVVEHGGGIFGFSSSLQYFPEEEYTIVVLDNTQGRPGQVAAALFNVLHGLPVVPPKSPIAAELHRVIDAEGIDAAEARYAALRSGEGERWEFGEQQLNSLGYVYLQDGRTDIALRVFKLNIDAYPEAWNTYDSYGEALAVAGRKQEAIESYQKALSLNPGAGTAKAALKKLGVVVEEQQLVLSAEIQDRYIGKYQLAPSFVLEITREGPQMYAQATGQSRVEIYPSSETKFYLTVVDAQITFDVDGTNPAPGLTLHQGGRNMPAKRMK